jgi:hypothetical protein
MSEIIEILGEKKFSGSKNKELKTRVVFEESKKIQYENNLFFDISQQTQYIQEKRECTNFRFYGKINPIFNLLVHQKLTNGKDTILEIDKTLFDMNLNNWSLVLLKAKQLESGFDANGKQTYNKGVKKLDRINKSGELVIDLDLKRGLPGRQYVSDINQDNFCIFLPLGHNFLAGDRIKVDSLKTNVLDSNIYNVVDVRPNMIYINAKPIKRVLTTMSVKNLTAATKSITDFTTVKENNLELAGEKSLQKINKLFFTPKEVAQVINTPRPKIQALIRPDFYVSKVVEKELLEYYIKTLEVVAIVDDIDPCAFSINNFRQQYYNFFLNADVNLDGLFDNRGEPVSDLYIGIIKNGAPIANAFSDVESHFTNYIESVGSGFGLEQVTDNQKSLNKKVNVGDTFLHSICEHTTENLTETEVSYISHRFLYKNICFQYKPFVKVPIKLRSPYIEDADNVENIPQYAIYSRQREKYIWRDIFDVGFSDENGNRIELPFMNDAFYVYSNVNFFLVPETSSVRKYKLNVNDVTSLTGSQFTNEFDEAFKNVDLSESNNPDDPNGIKPFNQYQDIKC